MHLPKSSWVRWSVSCGLGLMLLSGWHALRGSANLREISTPLPQDPYIQVYFNQNQASVYTDPYRQIERYGDNLEQVIINQIQHAQSTLDIAVHELNLPLVAEALCDRAAASVQVRLIIENSYSQPRSGYQPSGIAELDDHNRAKYEDFLILADLNRDGSISLEERQQGDAIYQLQQCQVPMIDDTADGSKGSGLMHHKFMVIDGQKLIVGSANWTLSDVHGDAGDPETRGNANAVLAIASSALAQMYEDEFSMMWGDGPAGKEDSLFGLQKPYRPHRDIASIPGSALTVQFSPVSETKPWTGSVNGLIARMLQQATSSADMALFVFSDQGISDVLADTARRGVQIRALVDRSFVYRSYSEVLDMLGTALPDHRCHMESNNRPWQPPILSAGTANLPSGDKLHHKFAVIDSHTVIIGSQNWSDAANHTNDENLLVIRNSTVAAHFQREFERLYADADLGMTPQLVAKQQELQQQCGL
ncbi:competence protein ComE [filamentous cyanobacterium CCP5]|nr:competence protein ComE [filamentous cyanobacterium CCP5]